MKYDDDYQMVKRAFRKYITKEERDIEGNPIITAKIGKVEITFYFIVDEYKDEANLDNIIVWDKDKPYF